MRPCRDFYHRIPSAKPAGRIPGPGGWDSLTSVLAFSHKCSKKLSRGARTLAAATAARLPPHLSHRSPMPSAGPPLAEESRRSRSTYVAPQQRNMSTTFGGESAFKTRDGVRIPIPRAEDGRYLLTAYSVSPVVSAELWHRRLMHVGAAAMRNMGTCIPSLAKQNLDFISQCDACLQGGGKRQYSIFRSENFPWQSYVRRWQCRISISPA